MIAGDIAVLAFTSQVQVRHLLEVGRPGAARRAAGRAQRTRAGRRRRAHLRGAPARRRHRRRRDVPPPEACPHDHALVAPRARVAAQPMTFQAVEDEP